MQYLADLLKIKIQTIGIEEVSALGAAYMAGLGAGVFAGLDHLENLSVVVSKYHPSKNTSEIDNNYDQWLAHINQLTTKHQ